MTLLLCWLSLILSIIFVLRVWLDRYKNLYEISRYAKEMCAVDSSHCISYLYAYLNKYINKESMEYRKRDFNISVGYLLFFVFHITFLSCFFVSLNISNMDLVWKILYLFRAVLALVIPFLGYVIWFLIENMFKDMQRIFLYHAFLNQKKYDMDDIIEAIEKHKEEGKKYGINYIYDIEKIEMQYESIKKDFKKLERL